MINFFKGIIVGIGGIAPGLSGSVLLVIFGLYESVINSIGTFFKNIRKNIKFLLPICCGFGVGVIIFSKIINYFLAKFEMPTRYLFLGLIIGTIPLFFKGVKKCGFNKKYYVIIFISLIIGILLFNLNPNLFKQIENPNLIQSIFLGVSVATSSIIPGVDSAVILSSLGLYELYVNSLATINLSVLIPAFFGLVIGVLVVSFVISKLLKSHYTLTFSILFGLFISIIPNILNENCKLGFNFISVISILMLIVGFVISFLLSKIENKIEK